ncbi:vanadium-dependent haloperoxidase [Bradyrhizobium sp. 199]|uniref:vanadium-dependent haloperoxidase n=1 Tax=Bradyrhizobium sp. 199 TaxID=2782664 RepID=UPI001FF94134|nr:vanadium-dependent haloperoxidase [Bradyrhizobium sp. 199]MCK1358525.1 vanadium-dependent haloperoxidase [Bradyrhizobium sp. 199]
MVALTLACFADGAFAGVVANWNERAVKWVLLQKLGPPPAERALAMMHVAMFDAANSIDRRYSPYLVQLPASTSASTEAAVAAAAAAIIISLNPASAPEFKALLAADLDRIPDGPPKAEGIKIGETVAAKVMESRENDGSSAPEAYRPAVTPGVYAPTPPMFVAHWTNVKPFAMKSTSQFRPGPPVALASAEWAADFNEIKALGRQDSTSRTAEQTNAARFWLSIGGDVFYPLVRSLAATTATEIVDDARLFALVAVARADSLTAVFEAKYHYNFWRPITAIRHGDNDSNPATERDATWRPIAETPMHPEYPCAHCIQAASMCAVLESVLGSSRFTEITMTSTTAPGITRHWTDLNTFVAEVSDARVWAGFHYRSSARVGREMGMEIGQYVVANYMRPIETKR